MVNRLEAASENCQKLEHNKLFDEIRVFFDEISPLSIAGNGDFCIFAKGKSDGHVSVKSGNGGFLQRCSSPFLFVLSSHLFLIFKRYSTS